MRCFSVKNILITLLIACASQSVQASVAPEIKNRKVLQDSLNANLKEARIYSTDKAAINYDKARKALQKAFNNPLGKANAEVYYQAGETEYRCFQSERNKPASGKKADEKIIYSSTAQGYIYYDSAYALIKQGKHQFSRKQILQLQSNAYDMFRVTQGFRATAGYYYNKKDWKNANHYFQIALETLDCEMLLDYASSVAAVKADFAKYRTDSIRTQILFSCAVTSVKLEEHQEAVMYLEQLKKRTDQKNSVYQQLCAEYLALSDSVSYESTLIEAIHEIPEEGWFPETLLSLYLKRNEYFKALKIIDRVIATTGKSASNLQLKGQLLEEVGNMLGAERAYSTAVRIDSTLLLSYNNLGRIYFNRAVSREEYYITERRFDDIYYDVVPLYEEALPFYYKAFELDTKHEYPAIATAIRTILYKRFSSKQCTNPKLLVQKYNDVSMAYGMKPIEE